MAGWRARSFYTPGTVGIRIIMMTKEAQREPNDPGLDRILRAAVKHDFCQCAANLIVGSRLW
jgi:L-fuconolactonase